MCTFDPAVHLAWGDVALSANQPHTVRVFLKRLKTDRFERGMVVLIGVPENDLAPSPLKAHTSRRVAVQWAVCGWNTTDQGPVCQSGKRHVVSGRD